MSELRGGKSTQLAAPARSTFQRVFTALRRDLIQDCSSRSLDFVFHGIDQRFHAAASYSGQSMNMNLRR